MSDYNHRYCKEVSIALNYSAGKIVGQARGFTIFCLPIAALIIVVGSAFIFECSLEVVITGISSLIIGSILSSYCYERGLRTIEPDFFSPEYVHLKKTRLEHINSEIDRLLEENEELNQFIKRHDAMKGDDND